jgi:folate-binding protein YgfZ
MPSPRLFDRAVIRLSPLDSEEDVRDFLQGLVTKDTRLPGPQWAALLSPQGKCLFDFFLWDDGADVLIDCEASACDALIRRLSLYRLRRKVGIARDETLGVFWCAKGSDGVPDPRLAALGRRWIAVQTKDDADVSAACHTHRLHLGVCEGVAELGSDQTLWLECNAAELNGVSFAKGCYVGQENTARMNWRQKVNRRLLVVPLAQSDLERQRMAYPEIGMAVDHRRVESLTGLQLPAWLAIALTQHAQQSL